MKKLLVCIAAVALFAMGAQAQGRYPVSVNKKATTTIIGDVAVNQLVQKHIEMNERTRTISGYRIQVASLSGSNAKNHAFTMKENISETYQVEAYVIFDEPNFKVKVGDFITRLDAYAFLLKMRDVYPGTIIKDNIYPIQINWDEMVPESDNDDQD